MTASGLAVAFGFNAFTGFMLSATDLGTDPKALIPGGFNAFTGFMLSATVYDEDNGRYQIRFGFNAFTGFMLSATRRSGMFFSRVLGFNAFTGFMLSATTSGVSTRSPIPMGMTSGFNAFTGFMLSATTGHGHLALKGRKEVSMPSQALCFLRPTSRTIPGLLNWAGAACFNAFTGFMLSAT